MQILTHREVVSRAGKARAKKLSKKRRSEIARLGGLAKAKKKKRRTRGLKNVSIDGGPPDHGYEHRA